MRKSAIACTVGICLMALPAFAGLATGIAAYEKKDYDTALREFNPLAKAGDAVAQQKLGSMYRDGNGVPQDDKEALKWYRLAAEKGNVYAYLNLGMVYATGKAVQQDFKEAARWFRLAADQGDADSQFFLGRMYMDGEGVPQSEVEAVKWLRLAADHGNDDAQSLLGTLYVIGQGVPQDYQEAVKWIRLAAVKGNINAQYNLGVLYRNGHGVTKDDKEAAKWFRLAADKGYADAQDSLGQLYGNGEGVSRDHQEAVKLFRLAADQGHADAQNSLGLMYANGLGVPKRRIVAYGLNLVSVLSKNDKISDEFADLADDMSAEDKEEAQALSREMSKEGNLLKALDQYTSRQADAQLVLVKKKSARYIISADGQEVTDTDTELIWRRCAEGMAVVNNSCQGKPGTYTHDAAMKLAESEAARTGKDWHLPRLSEEIMTIRDYELKPAIHPIAFPDTPEGSFWSSSANNLLPGPPSSWILGFHEETFGADSGFSENSYEHFVRLVRTTN